MRYEMMRGSCELYKTVSARGVNGVGGCLPNTVCCIVVCL
jgi:hypothetical protein